MSGIDLQWPVPIRASQLVRSDLRPGGSYGYRASDQINESSTQRLDDAAWPALEMTRLLTRLAPLAAALTNNADCMASDGRQVPSDPCIGAGGDAPMHRNRTRDVTNVFM
ncbi:hypothetical protein KEM52_000781 [Ascosphaera acerosa]|nr:hypothetical protein KEM52_000781 [Ascosphaera acerosa]